MPNDTLGEFEHQVMLAALRLGADAYSVSIVLELEERTGREVSQAAVFITLRRLEEKGLLESRLAAAEDSGRERRYVSLTPEGLDRLRETRRTLARLWEGLDARLGEA